MPLDLDEKTANREIEGCLPQRLTRVPRSVDALRGSTVLEARAAQIYRRRLHRYVLTLFHHKCGRSRGGAGKNTHQWCDAKCTLAEFGQDRAATLHSDP